MPVDAVTVINLSDKVCDISALMLPIGRQCTGVLFCAGAALVGFASDLAEDNLGIVGSRRSCTVGQKGEVLGW